MDSEDFFSDVLGFFGDRQVIDDSAVHYGPLVLTLPRKEGKANTLLADHLFSPALFLAERIERGLLLAKGRTVIELGAGSGLPSLLLSTRPDPPSLIVVTDYPDEGIIGNLKQNVDRNRMLTTNGCRVECRSYKWGSDTTELLNIARSVTTKTSGYDIMILSDLLHFSDSHDVLISSILGLSSKDKNAKVFIGAGKYTHVHACDNFLRKAKKSGLLLNEIIVDQDEWSWKGTYPVNNLSLEDLRSRKANCRYWIGHWSEDVLV